MITLRQPAPCTSQCTDIRANQAIYCPDEWCNCCFFYTLVKRMFFPEEKMKTERPPSPLTLKLSRNAWERALTNASNVHNGSDKSVANSLSDGFTSDGGSESLLSVSESIKFNKPNGTGKDGCGHGKEKPPANKKLRRMFDLSDVIKVCDAFATELPRSMLENPPPPTSSSGPLSQFSCRDIITHCTALRVENMQRMMLPLLHKLMHHPRNLNNFNQPVDPVALQIPDYLLKIKQPMDLGTIKSNLLSGKYRSPSEIYHAICLVFDNAMAYNNSANCIHEAAKFLKGEFQTELFALLDKQAATDRKSTHACAGCFGASCIICGEKCLKLESALIVCSGSCGQRIKRNSIYYVSRDGSSHWCQKCHGSLPQMFECRGPPQVAKRDLLRRRSEEERVESWKTCSVCNCRMHEVCSLSLDKIYPDRLEPAFRCPFCTLGEVKALSNTIRQLEHFTEIETPHSSSSSSMSSSSSPLSTISPRASSHQRSGTETVPTSSSVVDTDATNGDDTDDFEDGGEKEVADQEQFRSMEITPVEEINEKHLSRPAPDGVDPLVEDTGKETAPSSSSSFMNRGKEMKGAWGGRAKDLPRSKLSDFLEEMVAERLRVTGFPDVASTITIRLVSNVDLYMEVPSVIRENLMTVDGRKISKFMPYRQKCILLFQEVDGLDVCLFCLYTHEFNSDCPEPNRSKVYIAYLDSIEYFRPMGARTIVYHEIIVGYLQWAQCRGFEQCHIWSCPPQRGDNFIFWCHPSHQRTPSRERLSTWYSSILNRATSLKIINNTKSLYKSHFSSYTKRGRNERSGRNISRSCSMDSINSSTQAEGRAIVSDTAPVAPPIFEGDYWVMECAKVHRSVLGRARATADGDKVANHRRAREIIKQIMTRPLAQPFNAPVDFIALNIPTYTSVISQPMDLRTVQEKLRANNVYFNLLDFVGDVRLTFRNAMVFNPKGHFISSSAETLLEQFDQMLLDLMIEKAGPVADVSHLDSWLATMILVEEKNILTSAEAMKSSRGRTSSLPLSDGKEKKAQEEAPLLPPPLPLVTAQSMPLNLNKTLDRSISDISMDREQSDFGDIDLSLGPELDTLGSSDDEDLDALSSAPISSRFVSDDVDDVSICRPSNFRSQPIKAASSDARHIPYDEPFGSPQLGVRGASSLMFELTKGVLRLKDDLFVVEFTRPESYFEKAEQLIAIASGKILVTKNTVTAPVSRGKGRPPTTKKFEARFPVGTLSQTCLMMLRSLATDTSDPDEVTTCPLLDIRQTFLEVCQYRSFQFDSLRRAKYSSLAMLYYLQQPYADHLRIDCATCKKKIKDVRWHCEQFPNYDICSECHTASVSTESKSSDDDSMSHYDLTPIPVTFR